MRFVTRKEMDDFAFKIKQTTCPFCKCIGRLIFHGYLRGYDEFSSKRIVRGRRIFCNNRKRSTGCGRTFSLCLIEFISGFTVSCRTVCSVIELVLDGASPPTIARDVLDHFSPHYVYFLITRLRLKQSFLRTQLSVIAAPQLEHISDPLLHTLLHLKAVFQDADNPVATFQHRFQVSFL